MADNSSDLVVETYKLTKIYQNRQIALNDVTLRIEPGCVLGLLGPNGAGKTTLLRLILGLHRATAGWVKLFGRKMSPNVAPLRSRIGYIPTNPQFPRGMTPITYLDYIARLFGMPAVVRKPRLATLIRAVDLLSASGDLIDGFSNGMTARLAVATSLINEPDLLIWDEPTHGLDPEARRSMLDLIKSLAKEKTLIVSSHNLADVDEVCNHAAVLSRGHLIYFGSLQDLKGRMRRNHYELDLEGDQKAIGRAVQAIKNMNDFKSVIHRSRRLELFMHEDANNASALANVFMTLADGKVTLVSIRSVGQQTEQAFLDLVEKEESRGFARAYQNPAEAAEEQSMDAIAPAQTKQFKPVRFLPYWAVFQMDLQQTVRSWVYRFWVLLSLSAAVGYLLYRFGAYREAGLVQPATELMSDLLRWTVFGSVTLIIILTAGSISAERTTLADSVLCRGISRHQYFLGKWHARLVAVLGTFFVLATVVLISSFFLLRDQQMSFIGSIVALLTVAAILTMVITCGVTISAFSNSTLLSVAILWTLLYGAGFVLSKMPAHVPSPDRALDNLPNILRGHYDWQTVGRLWWVSALVSLCVALAGMIHFSRRDV